MTKQALIINGTASKSQSAERGIKTAELYGFSNIVCLETVVLNERRIIGIEDIENYLRREMGLLAEKSTPDDVLFVYITAHGDAYNFRMAQSHGKTLEVSVSLLQSLLAPIKFDSRFILVSNCSGEEYVRRVINEDPYTVAVASLGRGEVLGGSKFNPRLFEELQKGSSVQKAFEIATAHVREVESRNRRPFLYLGTGIRGEYSLGSTRRYRATS